MAATQALNPAAPEAATPSAVVWIDEQEAVVAAMSRDGIISTCEISRGWLPESSYLSQVVRVIGARKRVVILGPSAVRAALERAYVAIFRGPDRLVDVESEGPVSSEELIDRLRILAA